jgi:hypothetical protein
MKDETATTRHPARIATRSVARRPPAVADPVNELVLLRSPFGLDSFAPAHSASRLAHLRRSRPRGSVPVHAKACQSAPFSLDPDTWTRMNYSSSQLEQ